MLQVYFWTTPNGFKPIIFLEELGIEFEAHLVDIRNKEQFRPDFLAISPNNKVPAIVDGDQTIFESGAILMYLANKYSAFLPANSIAQYDVLQWLFWQVGGLGPMLGQLGHFINAAPETNEYSVERYAVEADRLFSVLDKQLSGKSYICGDYSIADIACYPWARVTSNYLQLDLSPFQNVEAWVNRVGERDAVKRAYKWKSN